MITYINSNNAKKYSRLFKDAEDALVQKWRAEKKNPEDDDRFGKIVTDEETGEQYYSNGISSLNTYFSWINDLLNISELPVTNEEGEIIPGEYVEFDGMRFSMLPVDEEVFTIDANTRKITVPAEFATNGISVQGDEISEVVYFKINRFFDATDLFNQDIMIEWIAPSGLKGYSVPTVKVLDETTNYVIFGWALASAITETAGNVTFSVRFYKYDDDNNKIQYSLSTLTQTAKIQPNIGLDIPGLLGSGGYKDGYKVLGDEIKALIKERSENSNFGESGDKAEVPVLCEEYFVVDPKSSKTPYVVVLAHNDADDSWSATVSSCGYSNDAGSISYFWKKFNYKTGNREQTDGLDKLVYRDTYTKLPVAEAEAMVARIPAMKLWLPKMADGKLLGYEERTIEEIKADPTITHVYRQDTECVFDGVGYYKLVIKNRKGRATETFESDPIIVYPPNVPADVNITPRAFLDGDDDDATNIEVTYSIPAVPDAIPAYARIDPVKTGYKTAEGAIVGKYEFDPRNENVAYEWYHIALGSNKANAVVVEGATQGTFDPADEGDYFCRLTGLLNGAESATVDSETCRVTYKPARPIFTVSGLSVVNGNSIAISNMPDEEVTNVDSIDVGTYSIYVGKDAPLTLTYNFNSMMGSADHQLTDTLTGQWYCYELQRDPATGKVIGSVAKDDCLAAVKGLYTPAQRDQIGFMADSAVGEPFELTVDELVNVDGVVTIDNDFVPEKDGYYFCMITNKYNDKEAKISTPLAYYDNPNEV